MTLLCWCDNSHPPCVSDLGWPKIPQCLLNVTEKRVRKCSFINKKMKARENCLSGLRLLHVAVMQISGLIPYWQESWRPLLPDSWRYLIQSGRCVYRITSITWYYTTPVGSHHSTLVYAHHLLNF